MAWKQALFCILLPPNTKFMLFQLGAVFSHGLTKNCYFWRLALWLFPRYLVSSASFLTVQNGNGITCLNCRGAPRVCRAPLDEQCAGLGTVTGMSWCEVGHFYRKSSRRLWTKFLASYRSNSGMKEKTNYVLL